MKLKRKIGISLAVAAATYCVLAYIFMWPPVVTDYHRWHRAESSGNACINNLRQMDAAMNYWAKVNSKTNGSPVTFEDIKPYIKLTKDGDVPGCPAGGIYTISAVGIEPNCSLSANTNAGAFLRIRVRSHYFFWDWKNVGSAYHRLP